MLFEHSLKPGSSSALLVSFARTWGQMAKPINAHFNELGIRVSVNWAELGTVNFGTENTVPK